MKLVDKIFAIILEELNGYTQEEAEACAEDNAGTEAYCRIESLVDDSTIEFVNFDDEEPEEGDEVIVKLPKDKGLVAIIYDYGYDSEKGSLWCKMPPIKG